MSHLFFMLMAWTVVAVFSGGTIPEERASYANAPQLHSLINRCQPHVVVELGSCSSVATWDLARCIPPSGVLYAVDDWKEGALRQEFLFQAQALGLSEKVIPLEMEGGLFSQVHPDLVFLNARPTTVYRVFPLGIFPLGFFVEMDGLILRQGARFSNSFEKSDLR